MTTNLLKIRSFNSQVRMDIEDIKNNHKRNFVKRFSEKYSADEIKKLEAIVTDFISDSSWDVKKYKTKFQMVQKFMTVMMRKYKITPRKEEILYVYRKMEGQNRIPPNDRKNLLMDCFKKKAMRETSGVMVFALLSSPYPETGEFCYFEHHDGYNSLFIHDGTIQKEQKGTEVRINPATGIITEIINSDSVKINYINRAISKKEKTKSYSKTKTLGMGSNLSNLINPMTGELRQSFSCPFNCYFCPSQPDMPKSYEDKEPAVARSLRYGWSAILSMRDRFAQYVTNGMDVDKLEVIVKGGTWTSYNSYYRRQFCRDIFYAANTFWDDLDTIRPPKSLEEEQRINETAKAHVIGLTVETRPDYITNQNLIEFRECGITRLELGFQHTDNKILKKVNRQHTVEDSIEGIAKLLACGFKVDIHLMPGLPNSTFDADKDMVTQVLTTKYFRADQLKWYPTIVTPYTVIKDWYDKDKYSPWIEDIEKLIELTVYFKTTLNEWNRTNRIQRDFTKDFICGGSHRSNLGDMVKRRLVELDQKCKCIRCREVRNRLVDFETIEMVVRKFESHSIGERGDIATEYFISFEANQGDRILGFLRLRFDPNSGLDVFPELYDCAMIRELHVYGKMNTVDSENSDHVQHLGLGTKLVEEAKSISRDAGYKKISVISGVGVRNYYREKHNFRDGKYYLIADL